MAFPTKDTFTFDFEAQTDYPNWTPAQTKEYMNARGEELRVALNAVASLLNSGELDSRYFTETELGAITGAGLIGATAPSGLTGTTVQALINALKTAIDATALGQIPDGSITAAKVAADVATQTELDDLAGAERTTETVKGNADTVATHLADYATDTGVANAYVIALNPAPVFYEIGKIYKFKATNANTGASTFAIGALTATAIRKNVSVALVAGDIPAGGIIPVVYDGTNFQLIPVVAPTISDASETVKGISELATPAEATTGTDTTRVITPAGLAAGRAWKKILVDNGTTIVDGTLTLASAATQVDFASLGLENYKYILLRMSVKSDQASGNYQLRTRFNDIATVSYIYKKISLINSTVMGSVSTGATFHESPVNILSTTFYESIMDITNIVGNTKYINERQNVSDDYIHLGEGYITSLTGAITKISVFPISGGFAIGSKFTLLGVK